MVVKSNVPSDGITADVVYSAIMHNDTPIPKLQEFYNALMAYGKKPTEDNLEQCKKLCKTEQMSFLVGLVELETNSKARSFSWVPRVDDMIRPLLSGEKAMLPDLRFVDFITKSGLQCNVLRAIDKKISSPEYIQNYLSESGLEAAAEESGLEPEDMIEMFLETLIETKLKLVGNPHTTDTEKNLIKKSVAHLETIPQIEEYWYILEDAVSEFIYEKSIKQDASSRFDEKIVRKYMDYGTIFSDLLGKDPQEFASDAVQLILDAKKAQAFAAASKRVPGVAAKKKARPDKEYE